MEHAYEEVLHWVDPGPAIPGEAAASPETPWGGGHQTGWGCPALERQTDQLADGRQLWIPVSRGASLSTKILEGPRRLAAGTGKLPTKATGHLSFTLVACHLNWLVAC